MKIFKYIITFFMLFSTSAFAVEAPDDFLKNSVKEISVFINENKETLENDEIFLKNKIDELVIPKFDILLMSKIVLGKSNWQSMNTSQQDRFVLAFRGLMIKTYMKSLTAFDGEKIKFLPYIEGKRSDLAKVKSVYLLNEGEIGVNYRLKLNSEGLWKVFDVSFDGISLLKNYRSDFRNHITNHGINHLISELESK
ncbi:MAG: hypothetical protein CMD43_06455 [Gammaproteobacteria bacterium]|nr:hypothetical protein [Gammaproteobacteria bacterium]